jgi:N-glycosylase/DNA lyase
MADYPLTAHLDYPKKYLNLHYTFTCGQAFRWKMDSDGWWGAPVKGKIVRIKESESGFDWQTFPGEPDLVLFRDILRLDTDVPAIYSHLSSCDVRLAELIQRFKGLRLLRQEPAEALLSYVCSPANSVPRISGSIEALSQRYGQFIGEIAGRKYYAFPDTQSLACANATEVSSVGVLGWRGSSIVSVAQQILSRPEGWLDSLRTASYSHAKSELTKLSWIGPKIADCIALFALNKDEAVPVDTHVRKVACRHYMTDLKTKTLTRCTYEKIVNVFNGLFGNYAGWAQEFLFYDDLLKGRKKD